MLYSQSPPLAEKEWLTAEETSPGSSARDPDVRSDLRSGRRPLKAPIHSPDPSGLNDRPSIGRRTLRRLTRFSIAALIGVCATLGCPFRRRSRQSWLQLPLTRCSSLRPWRSISISCGTA